MTASEAANKLNTLNVNPQLAANLLEDASSAQILKGSADEVSAAISTLGSTSTTSASQMTSGFSTVGTLLKGLVSSPLGIASAVAAVTIGVMALADALTVSHDEALVSALDASQEYSNTQAELSSLNDQYLTTQQRIEELQTLKSSGALSLSDSAELAQLMAQNEALETQISAKERLLDIDAREANKTGEEYLSKTDTSLAELYDENGKRYTEGSKQADMHTVGMTDAEAIEASIQKVREYTAEIDSLKEKKANASSDKEAENFQKDIDQYQEAIDALETDMAERAVNMSSVMAAMTDTTSEAYQNAHKALTAYNTRDMSSSDWEEALTAKESYRTSSEDLLGFHNETFSIPVEYQTASDAITALREQLNGASEEEKVQIQAEIGNLYDIQNELLDAFAESEFALELDADSTAEEWQDAFNRFIEEGGGEDILGNMTSSVEEAKELIAGLLDIDAEDVQISIGADTEDATEKISSILSDILGLPEETISTFLAEDEISPEALDILSTLSGIPVELLTQLLATNGASGVIAEVLSNISGIPASKISELLANDNASGIASVVEHSINSIDSSHSTNISAQDNASGILGGILRSITAIPSFKKITVSTVASGSVSGIANIGKNITSAVKTFEANGTAHATGNWGLSHSGRALINELGSEIIVRNGRWFILNGGYPTMANLRAGDIIFNHRQSADILSHGYVTGSHARMVGSSYSNGTALSGRAYASGSQFKEQFDQIEILIDRMETAFKRMTDSVESLSYSLDAQNQQVDQAISKAKSNLASYQSAYQAYMDKANSVGLSASWINAVQNGSYSISDITDETLKDQIDDYKKYYEKALAIQTDIADLQKELVDLAMKKLENIDNYYSNRFDYNDDFGYANQIFELQSALKTYTDELAKQVSSGAVKQYSDEWYDAQKKIADYTQKLLDAQWQKFEDTINYLSRVTNHLEDLRSLKEASGKSLTEEDYQQQIDLNNQAIQESYSYRQQLIAQQDVYDVGSELYNELAKEISDLDSDIYKLMEDNEDLKASIWDIRFTNPLETTIDGLDETISSTKNLRSLLNKDSFLDSFGSLTGDGAAYLALLNQEMTASKQKIAEYTAALHKLDEAYANGILSQKDYEKSQLNFLKEIQDAAGDVQDYKDSILDLYTDQLKAEISYMDDYYKKRQKALDLDQKYYEFSKKVQSQSKSVNQLKAQIAALQGVHNASAQAELRRLEQELAKEEENLAEIKRDHANKMQDNGYDALSDRLDTTLDQTLNELTYNADKQEQVVADMLNRVVDMYDQAYGKIQEIISRTGFIGNAELNQNISGLSTQTGAQGQATTGTVSLGSIQASGTVSGVNTGAINQNPTNDAILDSIQQTPDIQNRPVAELVLSTSSLSLQQGKSAVVSARIRPTDAANKTLAWSSSDTAIATVSNGTIHAVKAGSASILCMTTDGSGITASVSVMVTAPPVSAPAQSQSTQSTGAIPFHYKKDYYPKNKLNINTSIVDRLKYHDYDSSMSAIRELYQYWGGSGYYSGTAAQNVWLLGKMKSAGYRAGSRSVPRTGADFIHDGEIIIRKADGGILVPLQRGDGVIPSGLTENLWNLAEQAPELLHNPGVRLTYMSGAQIAPSGHSLHTEFHFDTLLNIEGNASTDIVDELRNALPRLGRDLTNIVSTELSGDYRKLK